MSWRQLQAIEADHRQWVDYERSNGPLSCPDCGEPFTPNPPGAGGGRFCRFDGFQWPRDGWGALGEPAR